ncbi:Plant self-incompatibility S1 [Dillenia turbinata]|uniref:Plant self-incompatibility S1 n=1 Tax=Dillenia turbinata TaxID=194707 RepID=A0AAN8Z971_9MAGN
MKIKETLCKFRISCIVRGLYKRLGKHYAHKETKLAKGITIRDSMAPLKASMFIFFLGLVMSNLVRSQEMYKVRITNKLDDQMTVNCQSRLRQIGIKIIDVLESYEWEFPLDGEGSLLWTCVVSSVRSSSTFDAYDPTQDPTRCGPTECDWLAKPDGRMMLMSRTANLSFDILVSYAV